MTWSLRRDEILCIWNEVFNLTWYYSSPRFNFLFCCNSVKHHKLISSIHVKTLWKMIWIISLLSILHCSGMYSLTLYSHGKSWETGLARLKIRSCKYRKIDPRTEQDDTAVLWQFINVCPRILVLLLEWVISV